MNSSNENLPQSDGRKRSLGIAAYWINIFVQPVLIVLFVIGLAWSFGYLQRNHDWFNDASSSVDNAEIDEHSQYACSMLCVFVKAPGRCPVCGMELQKIESQGDPKDLFGVTIDPTSRRLSNISTVAALNYSVGQRKEVLGRITFDETTESTISAFVAGRIENLLVDFTGASVSKGDELAVLYSPDLYSDQVGLLDARNALQESSTANERIRSANQRLYESARKRLIELGMTKSQIDEVEMTGKANRNVRVYASQDGTVVERMVKQGDYVKVGSPILKVADLSKVWLMLELYPEDSNRLRIGQAVEVSLQSQPGKIFEGLVAFINPSVDAQTQTVKVRVVVPNEAGLIKIGDLGKATIESRRNEDEQAVVVPRDAVLSNGGKSVVYVETEPGRFEFRSVEVAERLGEQVSLASGVLPGEMVVSSGAFMLDSTFNIQGKVSLIDPTRAIPKNESAMAANSAELKEIEESFAPLSDSDRKLAEAQVICPVSEVKLGTKGMGTPITVDVDGTPVMICCEGCRDALLEDPDSHLDVLLEYQDRRSEGSRN